MTTEMSKNNKQAAHCVFCGNSGVTNQHVLPDWLKRIVPRVRDTHPQILTWLSTGPTGEPLVMSETHQRRGPFEARKVRIVCGQCNSGWMSRLESAAKPILAEMIRGNTINLDSTHQFTLAAWTVMTAIVAEYTHIPTQAIPASHRQHLMRTNQPPDGWRIWAGSYQGTDWKQRYRHHGSNYHSVQFSTFVIGSLLIHAASISKPTFVPIFNGVESALVQIWPSSMLNIAWPTCRNLSDQEANYIADAFLVQFCSVMNSTGE